MRSLLPSFSLRHYLPPTEGDCRVYGPSLLAAEVLSLVPDQCGIPLATELDLKVIAHQGGGPDRFPGVTYDGPHEFNAAMQDKAFAWLDRRLRP